jgi:hypothetical protein
LKCGQLHLFLLKIPQLAKTEIPIAKNIKIKTEDAEEYIF